MHSGRDGLEHGHKARNQAADLDDVGVHRARILRHHLQHEHDRERDHDIKVGGQTIEEALNQRSPDFPGVVICNASDSLGTLLQLIKKRRVHRLVVVEGDVSRVTRTFY